ncbi:phosphoserine phosphatase SerB [Bauldia sp.]|uniref:phosphoserine phosphatase SerB n=1 Tax=Bauldia sp. TaxID=2575872 RepID=UPI003BA96B0B
MTDFVATLIARPGNDAALGAALAVATDFAPDPWVTWLSEGEAVDVAFSTGDPTSANAAIAAAVADHPVDVVVQPAAHRRKKLLVADMDSTMIGQECIDELADYAGFKPQVAAITDRAMHGDIAFEPALHERASLLAGLSRDVIAEVIAERITPNPGAHTLVTTMRANGATAVLVSGGFTDFAEPIGEMIGFDVVRANRLNGEDGSLDGTVALPVVGPDAKRLALLEEAERLEVAHEDTLAVGDGANDIAMVSAAGLGVAYHAKPKLADVADARIDHADLTALLYLQGYRRDEFVT